jgi:hypothetical protein
MCAALIAFGILLFVTWAFPRFAQVAGAAIIILLVVAIARAEAQCVTLEALIFIERQLPPFRSNTSGLGPWTLVDAGRLEGEANVRTAGRSFRDPCFAVAKRQHCTSGLELSVICSPVSMTFLYDVGGDGEVYIRGTDSGDVRRTPGFKRKAEESTR